MRDSPSRDGDQIVYFTQDFQLKWAYLPAKKLTVSVPKGQQPATFTDADFIAPSICDSVKPQPLPSGDKPFTI
jgi:hypothetical protein